MNENHMGITLAVTAPEVSRKQEKDRPIFQLSIVLLVNVFGLALALSSAFRLPYHMGVVAGSILIYVMLFSLIYKNIRAVLSTVFLFGGLGVFFKKHLYNGFLQTISWVSEALSENNAVSWNIGRVEVYETIPMTMFFISVLFLLTLMLSYAVLKRVNLFLLLIVVVPILQIMLFFGCPPSVLSFVLIILGCFSLFALNQSVPRFRKGCLDARRSFPIKKQAGNISLAVSAFVGVVVMLAWLLVSEMDYAEFTNSFNARNEAGKMLKKTLSFTYEEKTPPQGGITGGHFADTGQFSFSGETALEVEADALRGSIYLKGFVGGDYNQNGWKPLSGEQLQRENELLPSEVISYDNAMLSKLFHAEEKLLMITKKEAVVKGYQYNPYYPRDNTLSKNNNDSYFAPYYDVINYDNNLFLLDREKIRNQLTGNLGLAVGTVSIEQLSDYFDREKQYSEYIYEAYTRLPENVSERLTDEFAPLQSHYTNIESLIKTVTGNLSSRAVYTLTPGNTPTDKDYVDYFLYENQKGYCTHFASAATVIFRLCNVPARYVEGYVVTTEDYTRAVKTEDSRFVMNIKDTNSHAWCEIYLDGFGWVPVEVTPGLVSVKTDGTAPSNGEKIDFEAEGENTTNEIPVEMPQVENSQAQASSGDLSGQDTGYIGFIRKYYVWMIVAAVVLTVMLIILFRQRAVRRRVNELHNKNLSLSCLSWYMYFLDALRVALPSQAANNEISVIDWAKKIENTNSDLKDSLTCAMPIIQKAAYGSSTIDSYEHESVSELLMKAVKQLYDGVSVVKRLKWRYFDMLPVYTNIKTKGDKQ